MIRKDPMASRKARRSSRLLMKMREQSKNDQRAIERRKFIKAHEIEHGPDQAPRGGRR